MQDIDLIYSEVKMPLMSLPVVTPLVKLRSASILISPGSKISGEQYKSIKDVTDIVAPNLIHSAGVPAAAKVFPMSKLWAVPGLEKHKPAIKWTNKLTEETWAYQSELPLISLGGMPRLREVVFFHVASKTLIVTDLAFNMTKVEGLGAWLLTHAFGTYKRFATSRLFTAAVKDKAAFEKSLQKIFSLDFENIVVSHGEPVIGGAKEKFRAALALRKFKV